MSATSAFQLESLSYQSSGTVGVTQRYGVSEEVSQTPSYIRAFLNHAGVNMRALA